MFPRTVKELYCGVFQLTKDSGVPFLYSLHLRERNLLHAMWFYKSTREILVDTESHQHTRMR